ncbi:MAG: hypothetical protein J0L75_17280 [Spirochaetes bacterium]|nr:hypothetical protein [Spirochaetota bacterium]
MREENQLTFEDDPLGRKYQQTFELIHRGAFEEAWTALEEIHAQGVSLPDLYDVMKCVKFWTNRRARMDQTDEGLPMSAWLEGEWKAFEQFLLSKSLADLPVISHFREAIWGRIIDHYVTAFQKSDLPDPDLLLRLSEALLVTGQYARAKETLLYARKFKPRDAWLHALLGDASHGLGENDRSVAAFRDAFYYNPRAVDLARVRSPFVHDLAAKVAEQGFVGSEINLWLPIYAELQNAFYAKRSLGEEEARRLERAMYEMEIEFEIRRSDRGELEPLLLNHYFRLLDHWGGKARGGTDEEARLAAQKVPALLKKIKDVNENIYREFRSRYA